MVAINPDSNQLFCIDDRVHRSGYIVITPNVSEDRLLDSYKDEIMDELCGFLSKNPDKDICINLAQIGLLRPSQICGLVYFNAQYRKNKGKCIDLITTASIRGLLTITGLEDVFNIYQSAEEFSNPKYVS